MKQKIQFTGKNLDDMIKLPCVNCIAKLENGKLFLVMSPYKDKEFYCDCHDLRKKFHNNKASVDELYEQYLLLQEKYPRSVNEGDWLVEKDDGTWRVEKGEKLKTFRII